MRENGFFEENDFIVYDKVTMEILPRQVFYDMMNDPQKRIRVTNYGMVTRGAAVIKDNKLVRILGNNERKEAIVMGTSAPKKAEPQEKVIPISDYTTTYSSPTEESSYDLDSILAEFAPVSPAPIEDQIDDLDLFVEMVNRGGFYETEEERFTRLEDTKRRKAAYDAKILEDIIAEVREEEDKQDELDIPDFMKAPSPRRTEPLIQSPPPIGTYNPDLYVNMVNRKQAEKRKAVEKAAKAKPKRPKRLQDPKKLNFNEIISEVMENLKENSIKANKTRQERAEDKKFTMIISGIVVTVVLVAGIIVGILVDNHFDKTKENAQIEDFNTAITYYLNDGEKGMSIVNANKHYLPGQLDEYGHTMFWLDPYGIAQKLAEVPPEVFDGALYQVYVDMGYHADTYMDQIIRALFTDLNSFDEYLTSKALVDPITLEPSIEKFIEHGRNTAILYADYMEAFNHRLADNQEQGRK